MYIPGQKDLVFPVFFLKNYIQLGRKLSTFTPQGPTENKMQSSFIEIQFQLCMASWNQWTFQHNLIGCTWAHRHLFGCRELRENSWNGLLFLGCLVGVVSVV